MVRFSSASIVAVALTTAMVPQAVSADGRSGPEILRLAQAATITPAPADEAALVEELKAAGRAVYEEQCAICHGPNGQGDIGPSLGGNGKLADGVFVKRQITQGGSEMPGFAGTLTPEQILAAGTYVRNSWGNSYGPMTE